jgi:signal transduction histidine kinase
VEDNEDHAELVSRAFEDDGQFDLEVVRSVRDGKARLEDQDALELVLADLRLPDGLGTDLTTRIAGSNVPLVVLTSQGSEAAAVDAIKAGATDYIVKSEATFADMPRIVRRVLREQQHIRDKEILARALTERERLATLGTAAAMLAHEIGNPLNNMALQARVLLRHVAETHADEEISAGVTNIVEEIRRLNVLLNEFRDLSRRGDFQVQPVDACRLLEEVVTLHVAPDSNVQVTLDLPDDPPQVVCDRDKIKQVLINLVKNASEAMSEGGGTLVATAIVNDATLIICVQDSGVGISEGYAVFEPFTTTKPEGTGLGLAIAHQIVVAHGGTLDYDSQPGRGTTFSMTLPLLGLDETGAPLSTR